MFLRAISMFKDGIKKDGTNRLIFTNPVTLTFCRLLLQQFIPLLVDVRGKIRISRVRAAALKKGRMQKKEKKKKKD